MLCELADDGLNDAGHILNPSNDIEKIWMSWTAIYQALPPLVATCIGYSIMHPEININGLDLGDDPNRCHGSIQTSCDMWNYAHGDAFNRAFWPPMLGYLAGGFVLLNVALILACTTKRELERGDRVSTDICGKIIWNSGLILSKMSCPPAGTVANAVATVFWSSVTQASYAVWGSWMLGLAPDQDTALDLAKTHAVGAAVIPSLLCTAHLVIKVFAFGQLNFCPPANYYQCSISDRLVTAAKYACMPVACVMTVPYVLSNKLANCCTWESAPVQEPVFAQVVDVEALVMQRQEQQAQLGKPQSNSVMIWLFGSTAAHTDPPSNALQARLLQG